ncbi:MAG: hypothetical protein ABS75_07990 [Pelagibacterium sp. SCN 63-23]|mgnify:CR=1 FL=1|nr:MAG: hypothetical protein ABS75_07990 [Pelagibacterium sp. SCN 63-23]
MGRDSAGAEGDHQGEAAEASEASSAQGYFLAGAHIDPVDDIDKLVATLDGTQLFQTGGCVVVERAGVESLLPQLIQD